MVEKKLIWGVGGGSVGVKLNKLKNNLIKKYKKFWF